MKKNVYVAVSTDPVSSYQDVVEYAKSLQGKTDFLHCDVMDGKFVERKTYDSSLVKNLNANTSLPLDVHLMVQEPLKDLKKYIDAGANIITVHYEAFEDKTKLVQSLKYIRENNVLAGISFKPETFFKEVKPYCFDVDLVLVMSVNPGLSGQKFLNDTFKKIKEIDSFRKENNLIFKIEVDGGVNLENAKMLSEFGADMLVSGNYVFRAKDRQRAIQELRE